ncbi:hypothetical protein N7491_002051 [Penicillium cf. griseofulvum]|uniref:Uncharacterized protein n=1 Tax=Penicillium cf. griseofulvum TaxID=2972120 RepID=A0A9W9MTR3_9EURO|nr:hypothetical protein N7472_003764 [Penicillium cf. griseofulvum]KAJ5445969.1 hypothetical protein N7491_002051 [Penicillium cf. griseofulvum]KAJ5447711.1 hypothetical protein N7445_002532 [Penicillium cf. griseofulvum]
MATLDCESNADGSDNSSDDEEDYFSAEEFLSPSPYLRPTTPQLYYEQHPAWWPVCEDNNFDLTRTCDPVDPVSMGRDYRARHQKTTPSQYSSDDTDHFVSCKEYLDEGTPDEEDDLYYSIVGPPDRPKGLAKSLEDRLSMISNERW